MLGPFFDVQMPFCVGGARDYAPSEENVTVFCSYATWHYTTLHSTTQYTQLHYNYNYNYDYNYQHNYNYNCTTLHYLQLQLQLQQQLYDYITTTLRYTALHSTTPATSTNTTTPQLH